MDDINELYKKLIYSIARKYSYNDDMLEDLYQVGNIGLIKALNNYNESASAKFSTYAHFYIKGEIIKYLRENKIIKTNPEIDKLNRSINKVSEYLSQQYNRNPTLSEIASYLEVSVEDINNAINSSLNVRSLDYEINSDEDKSNSLYDYEAYIEKGYDDDLIMLKDELLKLDEDERKLIVSRYYEDKSQVEISKELGMTQVQVSRKEAKILSKIRNNINRQSA